MKPLTAEQAVLLTGVELKDYTQVFLVGSHPREVRDKIGFKVSYIPVETYEQAMESTRCTNGALVIISHSDEDIAMAALLVVNGDSRRRNRPSESDCARLLSTIISDEYRSVARDLHPRVKLYTMMTTLAEL